MISKLCAASAMTLAGLLLTGTASAQRPGSGEQGVSGAPPAPGQALELSVGTGYAQGFGNVGNRLPPITDTSGAGGAIAVAVGYRVDPTLQFDLYGTGAQFARGNNVDGSASIYSATLGIEAAWHLLPQQRFDPWVSLGTGWRGYWVSTTPGTSSMHAWELARLQVGVDYRLSRTVALAPVIGADLSMFYAQESVGQATFSGVGEPALTPFVFAGVLGRFDIALSPAATAQAAAR